ncbi:hypothetical protein VTK56DRAFT_2816 [Thermocarpiscus australiensis]
MDRGEARSNSNKRARKDSMNSPSQASAAARQPPKRIKMRNVKSPSTVALFLRRELDVIARRLGRLTSPYLDKAIDIITGETGQQINREGELELDINALTAGAVEKLYKLVIEQEQKAPDGFQAQAVSEADQERTFSLEKWKSFLYKHHYIHLVEFTAQDGDLTIVISGGQAEGLDTMEKRGLRIARNGLRIALIACSTKLDSSLPGWRARIVETIPPKAAGHLAIAELSDGTPQAFKHLIMAAHHSPADGDPASAFIIQKDLILEGLCDIAKLSNQYNALQLIAGNVPRWIDNFLPRTWMFKDDPDCYADQIECLWIAYEFGLHTLFHQICFDLAYVYEFVFLNPRLMPDGVFGHIYRCREAYTTWLMADVLDYRDKLHEATKPGVHVSGSVCRDPSKASQCAAEQLRLLNRWIKDENLRTNPAQCSWGSEIRSPLDYFGSSPEVRNLWKIHPPNKTCGLSRLADKISEIRKDGKMWLLQWMAEKGDEARLVTEEHVQYMAAQKQKIPW